MKKIVALLVISIVVGMTIGYVVLGPSSPGAREPTATPGTAGFSAAGDAGSLDPGDYGRTVALVESAQRGSGGFARLRPTSPSVYSTHHFLRVADGLGLEVANRSGTVGWLRTVLDDGFRRTDSTTALSNGTHVFIRDYYDAVSALSLLDAAPADRRATVEAIQRFEAADGSYCFVRPRNGSCRGGRSRLAGTRLAVAALAALEDGESTGMDDTRQWLLDQWQDDEPFEGRQALSRASGIAISLERLGVPATELPEYEARRSWVRSRRATVVESMAAGRPPLIRLENYVQLRRLFGVRNETFREQYGESLVDDQLPDGGYHVSGGGYSEPSGTAIAVELFGSDGGLPDGLDREALRSFVRYFELRTGGFAPTLSPRETVSRSFLAVGILDAFDVDPADPHSLADWVADEPRVGRSGVRTTYFHAALAARFDVPGPSPERVERVLATVFADENASMQRLYYATGLAVAANASIPGETVADRIREARNEDGSYGTPATTAATFHAVATLDALGREASAPNRTVAWLRRARSTDGGYYLRRGDNRAPLPDVYATHLSVRALSVLGAEPARPAELRQWVESLESPNGGFYVYRPTENRTVEPTLQYTYWAITTLDLLEGEVEAAVAAPSGALGRHSGSSRRAAPESDDGALAGADGPERARVG